MKINFCAGPAVVPTSIIEQLQQMMIDYKNTGVSLLSISHRDKVFDEVHASIQKISEVYLIFRITTLCF